MRETFRAVLVAVACLMAAPLLAVEAGERVLGKWEDGMWYPATVQGVTGDRVKLKYDDGDVGEVASASVRPIDWYMWTRLECNFRNQGTYYPGVVVTRDQEQLRVSYDDGDHEDTPLSRCRSAK